MLGFKNNYFEVLEKVGQDKRRSWLWLCKCKCGKTTVLDTSSIKCERIKSCGCSRKGINKANKYGLKHGLTQHKKTKHPLYSKFRSMINRCYNAKPSDYPYYQGKGIKICEEWLQNPKSFIDWSLSNGWKMGLTIDRIDNELDYSPSNCVYITIGENLRKMHIFRKLNNPKPKYIPNKYCYKCQCTAPNNAECKRKEAREKKETKKEKD